MTIGENIKKYRKRAGMTQKGLGAYLSITQQQVAQYENGKRIPKYNMLLRMARIFKVNVLDLYDEDISVATDKLDEALRREEEQEIEDNWLIDIIANKALELSDDGRKKVIEYEDDLIYGGKYTRKE